MCACKFVDSFDHYATADMGKKWDLVPATSFAIGATGRWSSNAYRLTLGVGTSGRIAKAVNVNAPTLIAGAAFRFNGGFAGADVPLLAFTDTGVEQVSLRITSTGFLRVSRNGTTIVTASGALSASTWYFIEFKATVHNTAGVYQVRVNGAAPAGIADASSQNTRGTGTNNYANGVLIGSTSNIGSGATGTSIDLDDFYCADDTTAVNNDFMGDVRVEACFPTADGGTLQWTPNSGAAHFSRVNETAADTTSFLTASADNQIDLFDFGDVAESSGTVHAVQLVALAEKTDASVKELNQVINSDSTLTEGDTTVALATTYLFYNQIFDSDHRSGGAASWSIGHVNSAQFGIKQKA